MSKVRRIPEEYITKQIGGGVICPKCTCGNSKQTIPGVCPHCESMQVPDPVRTVTRRISGYVEVVCGCGKTVDCTGFTNTCSCGKDYNWNGALLAPRDQWGEETGETAADILTGL